MWALLQFLGNLEFFHVFFRVYPWDFSQFILDPSGSLFAPSAACRSDWILAEFLCWGPFAPPTGMLGGTLGNPPTASLLLGDTHASSAPINSGNAGESQCSSSSPSFWLSRLRFPQSTQSLQCRVDSWALSLSIRWGADTGGEAGLKAFLQAFTEGVLLTNPLPKPSTPSPKVRD